MTYITVSDVRARLPLITADVRADADVETFIAQAAAQADAALRPLYVLPLAAPIDPLITFVVLDLACGLLLENVYGADTPNDVEHPAVLKERAGRLLREVRAGNLYLHHPLLTGASFPSFARPSLESSEGGAFNLGPHILGRDGED